MQNFVARFVKDESGATAIEYGLIARSDRRWDHHRRPSSRHEIAATFTKVTDELAKAKAATTCRADN